MEDIREPPLNLYSPASFSQALIQIQTQAMVRDSEKSVAKL